MATAVYKQMRFPLLESITNPPPQFPDPYANTRFGVFDDGGGLQFYICNDGINWTLATTDEIIENVPKYNTEKGDTFWSTADASGNLEDYRLLGKELYMMYSESSPLFESTDGNIRNFTKSKNSEIVVFETGTTLSPNDEVLVTAN